MSYTVPDNFNNHHDENVSSPPNGGDAFVDQNHHVDHDLNKGSESIAVASQPAEQGCFSSTPVAADATVSTTPVPATAHLAATTDEFAVSKVPSNIVAEGGMVTTVPTESEDSGDDLFEKKRGCWGRNGSLMMENVDGRANRT
ncbi:hypothetical protein KEM56_005073, partial [Ascosphaera pollenicola]